MLKYDVYGDTGVAAKPEYFPRSRSIFNQRTACTTPPRTYLLLSQIVKAPGAIDELTVSGLIKWAELGSFVYALIWRTCNKTFANFLCRNDSKT